MPWEVGGGGVPSAHPRPREGGARRVLPSGLALRGATQERAQAAPLQPPRAGEGGAPHPGGCARRAILAIFGKKTDFRKIKLIELFKS